MSKKTRLLICCEGETERQYVLSVVSALNIKNPPKVLNPPASAPIGLLEEAYKEFCWSKAIDPVPFTEIWLVFDRDHHPSYTKVFELAPKLGPEIHLCWTNPCIEFWFWLHYSSDLSELKFDDELEVSREVKTVDLGNRMREIALTRRVQQTIKPETMLSCLRKRCAGYSKVQCPAGLVKRSVQACDNLQKVAQSSDPMKMGSALPDLLLRLARLAEEEAAPGAKEMEVKLASASAPTPVPEVVPPAQEVLEEKAKETVVSVQEVSLAEKSQKIHSALDPWNECVEPLRKCLEDWKTIRMTTEGVFLTNQTLRRLTQLFQTLKAVESATNACDRSSAGLETLIDIRKERDQLLKSDPIVKMRAQLRALGDILRITAGMVGLEKELDGLDLEMKTGAGQLPWTTAPESAPVVATESVSAPVSAPDQKATVEQTVATASTETPTEPTVETPNVEASAEKAIEAPTATEAKEEAELASVSASEIVPPVEEAPEDKPTETAAPESKAKVSAPKATVQGNAPTLCEEQDLWKACAEQLRTCIEDWKSIKVTLEGITFSDEALARLEAFFKALKVAEEASGTCNRSKISLETLEVLKVNRAAEVTPQLIAKMQKQYRALGTVMRATAKQVGWKKRDLAGIDFELVTGAGVLDEQAASVPLPELKSVPKRAAKPKVTEEQTVAPAPVEPPAEPLMETANEAVPEEAPEEVELRSRLKELQALQADFEHMMRFVVLSKGEPPQEMLPGLCVKAANVETQALGIVEACLGTLTEMPAEAA